MLEIAEEYVERHGGDRIAAAKEFTIAMRKGYGELPPYTLDNAALATIAAFDLDPRETLHFLGQLLGKEMSERDLLEDDEGTGLV